MAINDIFNRNKDDKPQTPAGNPASPANPPVMQRGGSPANAAPQSTPNPQPTITAAPKAIADPFAGKSLPELRDLQTALADAITVKQAQERGRVLAQIKELAKNAGMDLATILKKPAKKKPTKPAQLYKFTDADTGKEMTFNGKGRPPDALKKLLDGGKKLDDFKVTSSLPC